MGAIFSILFIRIISPSSIKEIVGCCPILRTECCSCEAGRKRRVMAKKTASDDIVVGAVQLEESRLTGRQGAERR